MDDYGFCVHCGAVLPSGAEFCPECGRSRTGERKQDDNPLLVRNPMSFFILLMGLFAAVSIIEAIFVIFFSDLFMTNLASMSGGDLDAYIQDIGLESREQFADIMYKEGVISMVEGILVAVACVLCVKRRFWKVAIVLCLAATLLLALPLVFMTPKMINSEIMTMVLEMAIGLLVIRGIYINRRYFR